MIFFFSNILGYVCFRLPARTGNEFWWLSRASGQVTILWRYRLIRRIPQVLSKGSVIIVCPRSNECWRLMTNWLSSDTLWKDYCPPTGINWKRNTRRVRNTFKPVLGRRLSGYNFIFTFFFSLVCLYIKWITKRAFFLVEVQTKRHCRITEKRRWCDISRVRTIRYGRFVEWDAKRALEADIRAVSSMFG